MQSKVKPFIETYVESMVKYVRAAKRSPHGFSDESLFFLQEDVDYWWRLLSPEERERAPVLVAEATRDT